jgi:hypothetical protein
MSKDRLAEALGLAEEAMKSIELRETDLGGAALKAARVARLLGQTQNVQWLMGRAERIAYLEGYIATVKTRLQAAFDPNLSLGSQAHPNTFLKPLGNQVERQNLQKGITEADLEVHQVRTKVYQYLLNVYYELRFGQIPDEVFTLTRVRVDARLAELVPDAVAKFVSAYDNIRSTNTEDWANAVHSCRRVLQAVADQLYPPAHDASATIERNGRKIRIGPEHYINRLMVYAEDHATSSSYSAIVGSSLDYLGNRLDAIYTASNKGTHSEISSPQEAARYIVYTYLLLGDLLSLA